MLLNTNMLSAFSVNTALDLVVCSEHSSCFGSDQIARHLRLKHNITRNNTPGLRAWIEALPVRRTTSDCPRPAHGSAPIPGLNLHECLQCRVGSCSFVTRSMDMLRRHTRQEHADAQVAFAKVHAQSLSSKVGYDALFVVAIPRAPTPKASPLTLPTPCYRKNV